MLGSRVPGRTDLGDALLFAVDVVARVGERFTVVFLAGVRFTVVFLAGVRFTVVFLTGAFFAGGIPYSVLDYTESKEKNYRCSRSLSASSSTVTPSTAASAASAAVWMGARSPCSTSAGTMATTTSTPSV